MTRVPVSLAEDGAELVREGFARYTDEFLAITRRARQRFEQRDWSGMQRDARERLELYNGVVNGVVEAVRDLLRDQTRNGRLWTEMRASYSRMMAGHPAIEVAETFFNSATRRVFTTVGVNPAIEFLDYKFARVPVMPPGCPYRTYVKLDHTEDAVRELLEQHTFAVPYADRERDVARVARAIEAHWEAGKAPLPFEELEMLTSVFYRRKGAYLVGRVRGGDRVMPLVLALVNGPDGVSVDAALMTEDDVSIVFSFTRSYFHVEVTRPSDVIDFLRSLMPAKPIAELYTALGHNKHGKTEFYRELQRHMARTDEPFDIAPGARGMVMIVFTMPTFDMVFKVIRDSFPQPKQTTRDDVKRRYELVFAHDRAGRLVDAQEFESLSFAKERFTAALLHELLTHASRTVRLEGDQVVIGHLYTERRVWPLDLYLREKDGTSAELAVLDYGQAIKDLAATNVFPGDFLLKNFGVTRHGRVIFYDYDELSLLDVCNFRELPQAEHPDQEMSEEPWFGVGPNDVFPEELIRFQPFDGRLREVFLDTHSDIYHPSFWRDLQARHEAGEVVDIYPYPDGRRFDH